MKNTQNKLEVQLNTSIFTQIRERLHHDLLPHAVDVVIMQRMAKMTIVKGINIMNSYYGFATTFFRAIDKGL